MSLVLISQSDFKVHNDITLNTTHYIIVKIFNKRVLQQIASNHPSYIEFEDFMKLSK